jgi:putative addiction module component (TIGR02574 family)
MINEKEILSLSVAEKIDLIDKMWDSIESESNNKIPIPEWQIEEINRRLDELEAGKTKMYTWEEVKAYAKKGL